MTHRMKKAIDLRLDPSLFAQKHSVKLVRSALRKLAYFLSYLSINFQAR